MAAKKKITSDPVELEESVVAVVSEEAPVEETPVVELKPFFGVVTNCAKLNIRKGPKIDAKIISVVEKQTKLTIDKDGSTKDWYKVYTENGLKGYCMKKFITIV